MSSFFRVLPGRAEPGAAVRRDTVSITLEDGASVEVLRVRDPRARRLRLTVNERGARLTLPSRTSLRTADAFLLQHLAWLAQQLGKHESLEQVSFQRGRTSQLPLRDQWLPLAWQAGRYTRISGDAAGLVVYCPSNAGGSALRRALQEFYEAEARADVARWLPRYLPTLPRPPARIQFKRMSSQWGSLAHNGAMALDLSLVLGRPEAFEYVLVHELCHLIQPNHSPAFWNEVEQRCPDWREHRHYFNHQGARLKRRLHLLLSA